MSNKIKILVVFGTRPEAVKMAPVIKALAQSQKIDLRVCVTAQHREMLDQVLGLFGIRPEYDLNIMAPGQSLFDITSSVMSGLHQILSRELPKLVIVHGDTTTTLAASLASYYMQIPVAHVEAGLRTGNIYSPWPEEINRKVTSTIAKIHFAPTELSKLNLLSENIPEDDIFVTGNTVIDTLLEAVKILDRDPNYGNELDRRWRIDSGRRLILVTGHRRESFGEGFAKICDALIELAKRSDLQIIYPVHLNPNVKNIVETKLQQIDRISLIEPQDYLPFVHLMRRASIILTDSGGVQEEAPSLGKPVLVMRDTTERPEAVQAGTVELVGTNTSRIVSTVNMLIDNNDAYNKMSQAHNPYGDGHAAARIVDTIMQYDFQQ